MLKNGNYSRGPIAENGVVTAADGLRGYMTSVFNKMFMALCFTGTVAYLCASSQEIITFMAGGISYLLLFATLAIVFYLSTRINKIDSNKAQALFWLYSALLGACLSPIFVVYTGTSIANSFFTASAFFGGMSLYGYLTKKDLTNVGSFMMVGLVAVVLTTLVNIFLRNSALSIGMSALCVVIFSGLTAYDIQRIRAFYATAHGEEALKKRSVIGALQLYLDFVNLFLALLRLMGSRK
jgi:FtsH-binding integral membrane protein